MHLKKRLGWLGARLEDFIANLFILYLRYKYYPYSKIILENVKEGEIESNFR